MRSTFCQLGQSLLKPGHQNDCKEHVEGRLAPGRFFEEQSERTSWLVPSKIIEHALCTS